MKTKKLIELLQKEDPSGELECCVSNYDIDYVIKDPAYYDGTLQVLERDESNRIIGAKYIESGFKVVIHPLSVSDAICNAIDHKTTLPIDYSNLNNEDKRKNYEKADNDTAEQFKLIKYDCVLHLFIEWVFKWTRLVAPDNGNMDYLKEITIEFFNKNSEKLREDIEPLLVKDEKLGYSYYESYADKMKRHWKNWVNICYDGMDWKFILNSQPRYLTIVE